MSPSNRAREALRPGPLAEEAMMSTEARPAERPRVESEQPVLLLILVLVVLSVVGVLAMGV
jgi:hypothetical protein